MKKYLTILKKCALFYGIDDGSLLKMLSCLGARVVKYEKGNTVFAEGSTANYIGIVLSGEVQLEQIDTDGNRNILSSIGPCEIFDEAFACAGVESLPISAIAEQASEIMLLNSKHILHTCHNSCGFHHTLIYNLMKNLALKVLEFHDRIEITSRRTTREKLLAYLNLQAKNAGSESFTIPFDRQELADYLGIDRSGLSAEIGKLKKEGIIENTKSRFVLL